jgi:hypothetical protein
VSDYEPVAAAVVKDRVWVLDGVKERIKEIKENQVSIDVVQQGERTGIWIEGMPGSAALQPSRVVIDGGSEANIITRAVADRLGWQYSQSGVVKIKTAGGKYDPILGSVKGGVITLNKRQRTEQQLKLNFLVIADVGGMYDVLLGKKVHALINGITDHHTQLFEYKCGYEQGEGTGLIGSIPVITEKQDQEVYSVSVIAVQVLHHQDSPQVATSAAYKLGGSTLATWLLWIIFCPVLWICQLTAKWVAPTSAPGHEWQWPGSRLGARKRVQAHRRSEVGRCKQHNSSMDAGMRKWAASQGYSWG